MPKLGQKDHVRLHLRQTKVTNMKMYIDVQVMTTGSLNQLSILVTA